MFWNNMVEYHRVFLDQEMGQRNNLRDFIFKHII